MKTNFRSGFTIVELIVIIMVIAILAALGIVGYGSWRESVAKKEVQTDIQTAASAMESFKNFGEGYPLNIPGEFSSSPNVTVTYVSGDLTAFCIQATSTMYPDISYFLNSSDQTPSEGTCDGGDGGDGGGDDDVVVTTLAGSGASGYADGVGTNAKFMLPHGVAVDSAGTVYVADESDNRIRKVTSDGVVTTLAGAGFGSQAGSGGRGFANGTGTSAKFDGPSGIAVDSSGIVYVADRSNNRIRKITPSGVVTTLAGSGTEGFANGTSTSAQFNDPTGVAVDSAGVVYVADSGNSRIRKITPSGVVTTLAGSGTLGYVDATGTSAQFRYPSSLAVDSAGMVYVTDIQNYRIRKITPSGVVTTLAGSGTSGYTDATGTSAQFGYHLLGVAVDSAGVVYVADADNSRIRKITPSGVVTTLAGSGTEGFANGSAATAHFDAPFGVAVNASGTKVYIGDHDNSRIRVIE